MKYKFFKATLLAFALSIFFAFPAWAQQSLGVGGNQFRVLISYFDAVDAANLSADLDYLQSNGITGIRIFPNWWGTQTGTEYAPNTLIDSAGNIRQDVLTRMHAIIDAAASRGMIVDVSFARETVQGLSVANYKDGVVEAITELANHSNVFFDLQNERDDASDTYLSESDVLDLRQRVEAAVGTGEILSASMGGSASEISGFVSRTGLDIINHHDSRDNSWWSLTGGRVDAIQAAAPGRPVYFGEPGRIGTAGATADNVITAVSQARGAGASAWTFHTQAGFNLNGSTLESRLSAAERDFLSRFRAAIQNIPWGGGVPGGTNPPIDGPSGPQGICPDGYIQLVSANASTGDAVEGRTGLYCDNDPVESDNVDYPVTGTLMCGGNTSGGTAFVAAGYTRCRTWNFDTNNNPTGQQILGQVTCGQTTQVTVTNANVSGGAWTTSPSTEAALCIVGTAVEPTTPPPGGGNTPTPVPIPPPTAPPTITGFEPETAVPGMEVVVRGTNLTNTIQLISADGTITTVTGTVNRARSETSFIVPANIQPGQYSIGVTGPAGSVVSNRRLTIAGGTALLDPFTLPVPVTQMNFGQLLQLIINYSLYILGIAVFVMVFWAGFEWFSAAGNLGSVSKAKQRITNAVIGAILLVGAYVILYTINPDLVGGTFELTGIPTRPGAGATGTLPEGASCQNEQSLATAYGTRYPQPAGTQYGGAPELDVLVNCLLQDPNVSSLTDRNQLYSYERTNTACNYTRGNAVCGACAHATNSCHYGGSNGTNGSLAIDFNASNTSANGEQQLYNAIRARATACNINNPDQRIRFETNHTHVSTNNCSGN